MKKRIISLILVVVMLLLTLCSCSFNYEKKNLTKYASFNATEFEKALLSLVIENGEFGTDEDARWIKVTDTIFSALATDKGTDDKIFEGVATKYDVIYYGYYVTATIKDKVHTVLADAMNPSKPSSIQLGLADTEGLSKLVEELLSGKDIKDYIFEATVDGTAKEGAKVYLSYTKTYSVPDVDSEGNPVLDADGNPKLKEVKVTVNYGTATLPTLPAPEENEGGEGTQPVAEGEGSTEGGDKAPEVPETKKTFLEMLVGQKVGTVKDYKVTENIDGKDVEVSYTGIKLHWFVEKDGAEIGTVKDKTYTATKTVTDVEGNSVDLKDVELTYHIHPMFYVDVTDEGKLEADVILKKLLGTDTDADGSVEDSEKGSLEIFTSEEYKLGDATLKVLVEKLITAYNELAKAESELKKAEDKAAKEEAEKTEESTPKAQDAEGTTEGEGTTEEKKDAVTLAKEKVAEKQTKVNELVVSVKAATNGEKTVGAVLVDEYKEAVYDNLEAGYKGEIKENLAKAIFELAEKYITYTGKLPKSAVKEAYERIENVHKYNFYQGNYKPTGSTTTGSTSTQKNFSVYKGNYDAYLRVALELPTTATKDECKAKMTEQAEKAVRELILVYTLADHFGDEVALTKEQKQSVKNNIYVIYMGVEESDLLHAMQLDNVMNHILEEKEEEDYVEDTEFGKNKVQYVRLSYTFKVEEEKDEETSTEGGTTEGGENEGTTEGGENEGTNN